MVMVNIRTRVAPVNIAFSSSRNVSLIERKMLQYPTFSQKIPSLYIERNKTPSFFFLRRPCLCLITLRGSETTLKPGVINRILLILHCKHVLTEQMSTCRRTISAEA